MITKAKGVAAVVGIAALAVAYQAGAVPGLRQQRTTQDLPRAKTYRANPDGRVYAVVQVCWEPSDAVGALHTILGPLDRGDTNVSAPTCAKPYARRGLVSPGDRVAVAWVLNAESRAKVVRWRITIDNVPRMGGNETKQSMLNACIVGTPPC